MLFCFSAKTEQTDEEGNEKNSWMTCIDKKNPSNYFIEIDINKINCLKYTKEGIRVLVGYGDYMYSSYEDHYLIKGRNCPTANRYEK